MTFQEVVQNIGYIEQSLALIIKMYFEITVEFNNVIFVSLDSSLLTVLLCDRWRCTPTSTWKTNTMAFTCSHITPLDFFLLRLCQGRSVSYTSCWHWRTEGYYKICYVYFYRRHFSELFPRELAYTVGILQVTKRAHVKISWTM